MQGPRGTQKSERNPGEGRTRLSTPEEGEGPLLLYDGACALCSGAVLFVLRHEKRTTLRFASLAGPVGLALLADHPELRGLDSMLWVEAGGARVLAKSAAALRVASYLGGLWRLAPSLLIIPRPLRDLAYDLVARHRHAFAGEASSCRLPPPGERGRFLDARAEGAPTVFEGISEPEPY